jgi:hypothetical protein
MAAYTDLIDLTTRISYASKMEKVLKERLELRTLIDSRLALLSDPSVYVLARKFMDDIKDLADTDPISADLQVANAAIVAACRSSLKKQFPDLKDELEDLAKSIGEFPSKFIGKLPNEPPLPPPFKKKE